MSAPYSLQERVDVADQTVAALRAEVERLVKHLQTANSNHEEFERKYYLEKEDKESAERRLAVAVGALKEIREIWAGAEVGEPVHAQEAYTIRLCKQMYQAAVRALRGGK